MEATKKAQRSTKTCRESPWTSVNTSVFSVATIVPKQNSRQQAKNGFESAYANFQLGRS